MRLEIKSFFRNAVFGNTASEMKEADCGHLTVDYSLWLSLFALQNGHESILMQILLSDFSFTHAFNLCCSGKDMFLRTTCLQNAQMITLRSSSPPYQYDLWICEV